MTLDDLLENAAQLENKTVAVAAAEDGEVLEAVKLALEREMADFMLFGNKEVIETMLLEKQMDSRRVTIHHARSAEQASEAAVKAVFQNEADVLMKGNVPTAVILKAVLNKEFGLRTGNILSHVAVFDVPGYDRYTIVTDAAMNVAPDLQQKSRFLKTP